MAGELVHGLGRSGRFGALVGRFGISDGYAQPLGVGVGDGVAQALTSKHHRRPVVFLGTEEDLKPLDGNRLLQLLAELRRPARRDAAGPTVGNGAGLIDGGEVSPDAYVIGLHGKVNPSARKRPPVDEIAERVVAEDAQVPRAASGSDAGSNGVQEAHARAVCKGVEVRGPGRLELRWAAGLHGQPT